MKSGDEQLKDGENQAPTPVDLSNQEAKEETKEEGDDLDLSEQFDRCVQALTDSIRSQIEAQRDFCRQTMTIHEAEIYVEAIVNRCADKCIEYMNRRVAELEAENDRRWTEAENRKRAAEDPEEETRSPAYNKSPK